MILYAGYDVTFQEVPNEISLTIAISDCPYRCNECHSPWLRQKVGQDLERDLPYLLSQYGSAITCVCLMGDGQDPLALHRCINIIKGSGLKVCVYSGRDDHEQTLEDYHDADYVKVGSYQKDLGGLASETTNQRMYHLNDSSVTDVTSWFWREKI